MSKEMPWYDCKIAFSCFDTDKIWQVPLNLWPSGYLLDETTTEGARGIAVFTCNKIPTIEEGNLILKIIEQAEQMF